MRFSLPELEYGYAALSPVISEEIMRLHHTKHHQGYVDKLNLALQDIDASDDLEQILRHIDNLPQAIRTTVRNNGGGHLNHSQFWQFMCPGGKETGGDIQAKLVEKYGSFDDFKQQFNMAALSVFGSGWAWLMPDLSIETTPNQDNPIMFGKPMPIFGCDVWEHAYYLDYKNDRSAYMDAWWGVVDWSEVEKRYGSVIIS